MVEAGPSYHNVLRVQIVTEGAVIKVDFVEGLCGELDHLALVEAAVLVLADDCLACRQVLEGTLGTLTGDQEARSGHSKRRPNSLGVGLRVRSPQSPLPTCSPRGLPLGTSLQAHPPTPPTGSWWGLTSRLSEPRHASPWTNVQDGKEPDTEPMPTSTSQSVGRPERTRGPFTWRREG